MNICAMLFGACQCNVLWPAIHVYTVLSQENQAKACIEEEPAEEPAYHDAP